MPCQVDDDGQSRHYYRNKASEATRLLCDLMHWLLPEDQDAAMATIQGLRKWWMEHQAEDQARHDREQELERQHQRKQAALEKLTPEERRLLGLER